MSEVLALVLAALAALVGFSAGVLYATNWTADVIGKAISAAIKAGVISQTDALWITDRIKAKRS